MHSSTARTSSLPLLLAILLLSAPLAAQTEGEDAPAETTLDEIVVTAKFSILEEEPVGAAGLDREEIMELPHFGDDLYRAVMVLPGTASGDITGRFAVRGGLHREILARLDGVELFEPFHLKDFQGIFTILDPQVMGGVDLIPSGFPAEYGDRLGSVLDLRSRVPSARRTNLGISFSNAWFGTAGTFGDGAGHYLASLRRGYLDIVLKLAPDDEEDDEDPAPRYWDSFVSVGYQLGASQSLALKVLAADDSLTFTEHDFDESTDITTGYGNDYVWLSHQGLLGSRAFVDTIVSAGRVSNDRQGQGLDGDEVAEVFDDRAVDILALRQDWNVQPSERHYLKWGLEARAYDASYVYRNFQRAFNRIDDPRFPPGEILRSFADDFDGEQYALYAADRLRLGRHLTAEVGLRYDSQTLTDEEQTSPRLNLVHDLGAGSSLVRLGWGRFYQSQRPHELGVEFGETAFHPAERSEHWTVGFEKQLRRLVLRADAYRREVADPRPRWETLFDPFSPFPEFASDVVKIAPTEAVAEGLELYVSRRGGGKFDWWLSYALSQVEDRLDGVWTQRSIDQTHALTWNASYRPSRKWNLNWVFTYHTGWPATDLTAELVFADDGSAQLVHSVGPFYAERHDDYHRLDLRASRTTRFEKRGELTFFIDVQNLYNRENARGVDVEEEAFHRADDGSIVVTFPQEDWLGLMPSFGVSWEF